MISGAGLTSPRVDGRNNASFVSEDMMNTEDMLADRIEAERQLEHKCKQLSKEVNELERDINDANFRISKQDEEAAELRKQLREAFSARDEIHELLAEEQKRSTKLTFSLDEA